MEMQVWYLCGKTIGCRWPRGITLLLKIVNPHIIISLNARCFLYFWVIRISRISFFFVLNGLGINKHGYK